MTIPTALTRAFGLECPVVSAPMARVSGGRLAAAVSEAGGLGLVGGGYGDAGWMEKELAVAKAGTKRAWGVGLITWRATRETVDLALGYEPHAFMLSFGEARPFVQAIKSAGCVLILQVQSVPDARVAAEAGADFIVAQGTEAGGHGSNSRSTLPLVPSVVDAVSPVPVLAAGGIADGRGLAAALMLGAEGVLVGTRFYACAESSGHHGAKERLVSASGGETRRTRVFDVVRGHDWPEPYTGRALVNQFVERWEGREDGLEAAKEAEADRFREAEEAGDFERAMVWSGEGADLIRDIPPAAEVLRRMNEVAAERLRSACMALDEGTRG